MKLNHVKLVNPTQKFSTLNGTSGQSLSMKSKNKPSVLIALSKANTIGYFLANFYAQLWKT
jgi:hypothetical protein